MKIEAGDWVLIRDDRGSRVVVIADEDHAASLQGASIVKEVRTSTPSGYWKRMYEIAVDDTVKAERRAQEAEGIVAECRKLGHRLRLLGQRAEQAEAQIIPVADRELALELASMNEYNEDVYGESARAKAEARRLLRLESPAASHTAAIRSEPPK